MNRVRSEPNNNRGKHALKWLRLSCIRFAANAVRVRLNGLAYNLANFVRTLVLAKAVETRSSAFSREWLIKTGAFLLRYGRHALFEMAEATLPQAMSTPLSTAPTRCAARLPWRRRHDRVKVGIEALRRLRSTGHAVASAHYDQKPVKPSRSYSEPPV